MKGGLKVKIALFQDLVWPIPDCYMGISLSFHMPPKLANTLSLLCCKEKNNSYINFLWLQEQKYNKWFFTALNQYFQWNI